MSGGGARLRLVVFTRYPEPGTTKTRLVPALGAEGAAELQRRMTEHTLARLRPLETEKHLHVEIEIRVCGAEPDRFESWLGDDLRFVEQGAGDLGRRMLRAFEDAMRDGAPAAVIVGVDAPDLSPAHVARAFEALGSGKRDLVLGPAEDGGYYLVGATRPHAVLFELVPWGTDGVLRITLDRARNGGLEVALLEPLRDVDRPEDLEVWESARDPETGRSS